MTPQTFRCECGGEEFTGTAVIAVSIDKYGIFESCISEVQTSVQEHEVSCNDCGQVGNINDFLENNGEEEG